MLLCEQKQEGISRLWNDLPLNLNLQYPNIREESLPLVHIAGSSTDMTFI